MNEYQFDFVIIVNNRCPLYKLGDEFILSGRSLFLMGKATCMTLMEDMLNMLKSHQNQKMIKAPGADCIQLFNCSGKKDGCTGAVRLRYQREKRPDDAALAKRERENDAIAKEIKHFPIFANLTEPQIKDIVSYFRIRQFARGEQILKKGDPGVRLYIILSGKVEVVGDYGLSIASLTRGEVFGEMSLLTGNPVSSTVVGAENSRIMFVNGNYFRAILNRFPVLQMYFAQLLIERLSKSNAERSKQFATGMAGSLSEITTAELLQTLNMTQKTGILTLNLPDGKARISIRDGEIINARYNQRNGETAFFKILKEDSGNFQFELGLPTEEIDAPKIGEFMYLLMEGLNRVDEDSVQATLF